MDQPLRALSINTGSSSLKLSVFATPNDTDDVDETPKKLAEGAVERIGDAESRYWLVANERRVERAATCPDHRRALELALGLLSETQVAHPDVVGHRVVHGGSRHVAPELVRPQLLASLRELVPLAPLHLPPAILGIEAVSERMPGVPQVACFDTAFHATLPEVAWRLPLPSRFPDVRRYGFHGLSYESAIAALGEPLPARLVIAHLGSGASLVAVKGGRAIDTTMGLTPAGGIPMGTRSGDLDPGAIVYLQRQYGLSTDDLERVVDRESGLLALGASSDMKVLLGRRETDAGARLAVDLFAYGVKKAIGAFIAALGGIDALVFTGGIGEHAPEVRALACAGLEALGVVLDAGRNARNDVVISSRTSACEVRVIAAEEDRVIARHALRLVSSRSSTATVQSTR